MSLQLATFALDAFGDRYFHGFTEGQHWNGFACPLFPLEEALRLTLINNATTYCGRIEYDPARDAFLFYENEDESDAGNQSDAGVEPQVYAAANIDGMKLYAIGAFGWTWDKCDPDADDVRFSAELVRELRELRRLGTAVPDRAFDLATDARVLNEHLDMGVTDAADLIIQLAQVEPAAATQEPPQGNIFPATGAFLRAVVLPVQALDEYGEPIAPGDLQHVAVASREPTDGDDPNVSAWGVYGEAADGVVTHLADSPTREIAEAIAFALNQFVPPAPAPKNSFIVTVMPNFEPEDGTPFDAVVSALQHFEIPACIEVRK